MIIGVIVAIITAATKDNDDDDDSGKSTRSSSSAVVTTVNTTAPKTTTAKVTTTKAATTTKRTTTKTTTTKATTTKATTTTANTSYTYPDPGFALNWEGGYFEINHNLLGMTYDQINNFLESGLTGEQTGSSSYTYAFLDNSSHPTTGFQFDSSGKCFRIYTYTPISESPDLQYHLMSEVDSKIRKRDNDYPDIVYYYEKDTLDGQACIVQSYMNKDRAFTTDAFHWDSNDYFYLDDKSLLGMTIDELRTATGARLPDPIPWQEDYPSYGDTWTYFNGFERPSVSFMFDVNGKCISISYDTLESTHSFMYDKLEEYYGVDFTEYYGNEKDSNGNLLCYFYAGTWTDNANGSIIQQRYVRKDVGDY